MPAGWDSYYRRQEEMKREAKTGICYKCQGTGRIEELELWNYEGDIDDIENYTSVEKTCPRCGGTGRV